MPTEENVTPVQATAQATPAAEKPADERPFELVPTSEFKQIVETLLFITDRPIKPTRIADVIDGVDARRVRVVGKKDTIGRPMVYGTTDEFLRIFGLNKISELPDLQEFASKTLREKQEELPFGEPLPPLKEPAIIPLEELEGEEKLQALDASSADPFFTRNSYNRGDIFTNDAAPELLKQAALSAEEKAPVEAVGVVSTEPAQDTDPALKVNEQVTAPDNALASLQARREEAENAQTAVQPAQENQEDK